MSLPSAPFSPPRYPNEAPTILEDIQNIIEPLPLPSDLPRVSLTRNRPTAPYAPTLPLIPEYQPVTRSFIPPPGLFKY